MIEFIVGIVFGILIGIGVCMETYTIPKSIENGCSEYNKTTGKFQWIDRSVK